MGLLAREWAGLRDREWVDLLDQEWVFLLDKEWVGRPGQGWAVRLVKEMACGVYHRPEETVWALKGQELSRNEDHHCAQSRMTLHIGTQCQAVCPRARGPSHPSRSLSTVRHLILRSKAGSGGRRPRGPSDRTMRCCPQPRRRPCLRTLVACPHRIGCSASGTILRLHFTLCRRSCTGPPNQRCCLQSN